MKLPWFGSVLSRSFISTEPYAELSKKSKWTVLGLFTVSMIAVGISASARWQLRTLPVIKDYIGDALNQLRRDYPSDLRLSWNGQRLFMSNTEPLYVPYPSTFTVPKYAPDALAYLVPSELSLEQVTSLPGSSFFVITPTTLFVNDLDNDWSSTPLNTILDPEKIELNRTTIDQLLNTQQQKIDRSFYSVKKTLWAIGPLWVLVYRLLCVFFLTSFAYLMLRSAGSKVTFSLIFKLALHISIVAATLYEISQWLYPTVNVPLFLISFSAIFAYVWLARKVQPIQG